MHIVEGPAAADLLSLQAAEPARFPCLLESAAAHPRSGRFDLLMMVDTAADAVDTVYDADPFQMTSELVEYASGGESGIGLAELLG